MRTLDMNTSSSNSEEEEKDQAMQLASDPNNLKIKLMSMEKPSHISKDTIWSKAQSDSSSQSSEMFNNQEEHIELIKHKVAKFI